MEAKSPSLRKNPSRETCEGIIRRILMTEVLEKGKNEHFRTAADFMKYFESLYPASDALTKQVQRAIRSLNMPKDELGYFIPSKTAEQLAHEQELTYILKKANADVCRMDDYQPLFLKADEQSLLPAFPHHRLPSVSGKISDRAHRARRHSLLYKEPESA